MERVGCALGRPQWEQVRVLSYVLRDWQRTLACKDGGYTRRTLLSIG